jgi:hypothetical protein
MNDDSLYALVRAEFEPVRLPYALDDVTARGRQVRRRRRMAGAVAAAALVSGLALTGPGPKPVQLAAWSVDARPDGTVVLTIRELNDADRLTAALKRAGIPALVEFKVVGAGVRLVGCEVRQPSLPQLYDVVPTELEHQDGDERTFTIRRTAMPAGTSLHVVIFEEAGQRWSQWSLVQGRPLPCELLR